MEVILYGGEETILPCNDAEVEKERRLFHVGLTRAKERVHLLNCRNRFLFGKNRQGKTWRFLSEFDESLKETTLVPVHPRRSKESKEPERLPLL